MPNEVLAERPENSTFAGNVLYDSGTITIEWGKDEKGQILPRPAGSLRFVGNIPFPDLTKARPPDGSQWELVVIPDPPASTGQDIAGGADADSSLIEAEGQNSLAELEQFENVPLAGADTGGKKRKVPALGNISGSWNTTRDDEVVDQEDGDDMSDTSPGATSGGSKVMREVQLAIARHSSYRQKAMAKSGQSYRKTRFLSRKAALLTLFLDGQNAVADDSVQSIAALKTVSTIPSPEDFEKLLPSLESVPASGWPMDAHDWRETIGDTIKFKPAELPGDKHVVRLNFWKTQSARRMAAIRRKRIPRGGWAPEGSFEFEFPSKAASIAKQQARDRATLLRLANDLRVIIRKFKPKVEAVVEAQGPSKSEFDPPQKNKRRIEADKIGDSHTSAKPVETAQSAVEQGGAPAALAPPVVTEAVAKTSSPGAAPIERSVSKDTSERGSTAGSGTGKKKPKKKKRSVLANQSNPHHVDNYRTARTITPPGDPYEPYPSHNTLVAPPPMRLLSARPQASGPALRPAEDDYLCGFCEYELFYGSEKFRRAAIRRRREEIKRKEKIKTKAKNVAEGKGTFKDGEDEDDYDDEEGCEDDCYGKCSCGRSLRPSDVKNHLKPPDPDPDPASASDPLDSASTLAPTHPAPHAHIPLRLPSPFIRNHDHVPVSRASTPSID